MDWDGPAILSSVQNDLFDATVRRRLQLGEVYLFDPMRTIPDPLPDGVQRCGWSPLHSARTVSGPMEAANLLMEAAPREGVNNANYWSRKGEALLWPMLFAARSANAPWPTSCAGSPCRTATNPTPNPPSPVRLRARKIR